MGAPPTTTPAPPGAPPEETPGLAELAEAQLVGSRAIRFITHRVQPPAALYVTADDGLYVTVSNLQAALSLTFAATLLLPDGRIQPNTWTVTPPGAGTQTSYLFPLTEAFLLNVSVLPTTSVRHGNTWVICAVRRGGIPSGTNLQLLFSDYVDSYGGPTWPGPTIHHAQAGPGLILTSLSASTPAGQNYTFTVPAYARILLRSVLAQLTTSSQVGTRQARILISDGGGAPYYHEVAEPTQAASTTNSFVWGLKLGYSQTAFQQATNTRGLPELHLLPGFTVNIGVFGMQSLDVISQVNINYEQWFTF